LESRQQPTLSGNILKILVEGHPFWSPVIAAVLAERLHLAMSIAQGWNSDVSHISFAKILKLE